MKSQEIIHIAVAETSMIVRSGLVAVLKRLPDLNVQTVEITSKEGLQHCMEAHQPEILIVNPQFEGWFDLEAFKQQYARQDMKIVSLICTVVDANQLKGYDESINLFDDLDAVAHKISTLMNVNEEEDSDQNSLSQREKEIIGCVVRGDTPHFDYVCAGTTQGIAQLNATGDVPVIYGLITTNTMQQAADRAGGK